MTEHRLAHEFRVSGRTLTGAAMVYGDVSPDFRERFEPGAFGEVRAIAVNLQHDPSLVVVREALLTDTPRELRVRADLPPGSAALALVKRGALNGFSIEFHARAQRYEAGVRVVERAELTGLALVDRGAYPQSTAEVRARSGRTMRATIPSGRAMDCACVGDGCRVNFTEEALAGAIEEGESTERTWIAAFNDFGKPVASARRGTVRARMVGKDVEVEIDIPDSEAGRAVLAAQDDAGVVVRPFVDRDAAETLTDTDGTTVYTKAPIRAFIISSTDARSGWPDPVLVPTPGMDPEGRREAQVRRRLWL